MLQTELHIPNYLGACPLPYNRVDCPFQRTVFTNPGVQGTHVSKPSELVIDIQVLNYSSSKPQIQPGIDVDHLWTDLGRSRVSYPSKGSNRILLAYSWY